MSSLWNHSSPTFPIPGQSLIVTDCWSHEAFEGQILINVWPIQPIRAAAASNPSFLTCFTYWTVILCTTNHHSYHQHKCNHEKLVRQKHSILNVISSTFLGPTSHPRIMWDHTYFTSLQWCKICIGKRVAMTMTHTKTNTKTKTKTETLTKTTCLKDPSYAIFSKEWGVQGYQWWPPGCLTKIEIARPGTCVLHKGWSVFRSTQNFFLTRKIDEYQWQYRNLLMGTLSRGWILKARSRKVLQFNRNTVQLCYISSAWYFDLFFIVGFQVATI